MKTYKLRFSKQAEKDLSKLDFKAQKLIASWLRKNIENCDNPRIHGKALSSNLKGKWRYRVGDYRIICVIKDDLLLVLAIAIGHRRDVYDI